MVLAERSIRVLTLSFCLGGALAFSPYVGLQTWLAFPLCWIFGLNVVITIAGLYIIGNPFTMGPIAVLDYVFGKWIVDLFKLDFVKTNPEFIKGVLAFIKHYFFDLEKLLGGDFCFWCFFIGGHLLSLLVFIVLYPIMKTVFTFFVASSNYHENNNSK